LPKLCLRPADTIKTALDRMERNKPKDTGLPGGIVLVLGSNSRLLGIATTGDLRKALSKGVSMDASVTCAMNKTPFLIEGRPSNLEIISLVVDKVRNENWHKDRLDKIILVDKEKKILDLLSFYDLWHQTDARFKHIGIIGLGYVGLTLGITLADLGFKVRGADKNKDIADGINKLKPHFFEAGLQDLLRDNLGKNFKIVKSFNGENNCDVYFVCVGTPLNKSNKPELKYLEDAMKMLGKVLKAGDTVILRSTVPVGATRTFVVPVLERVSGLKAGEGFLLAFAPERTIEGKALEELRKLPQVIGGINHKSAELASNIFGFMTSSTVLVDSLEEAEMVKLINNTYRDVTFGFANEVSLVAQRWGIDAKRVIEAANYGYERSRVPSPSPGVGGYCLEKDPFIFIESAKTKGYTPMLFKHAREVSVAMENFVVDSVLGFLKTHKKTEKKYKVLSLGLAFKGRPVTSDIRGSTAINILNKILKDPAVSVFGFDPAVRKEDVSRHKINYVKNLEAGLKGADAVLVLTNHPHFETLNLRKSLALARKPVFLFDTWGVLNKEEASKIKGVHYKRL